MYKIYIAKTVTILHTENLIKGLMIEIQSICRIAKQSLTINCNYSIFSDVMKLAL